MKIGMRLHGGLPATRCVELARMAEDAGFQSLWFAENPFNRGVWPSMTACLLATKTITIGVGVFNPYNRHPTLMAMEMAAFDELAQGRTALGIGSGIADRVTRMGLSYAKPLAALKDCATIVRGMLREGNGDPCGKRVLGRECAARMPGVAPGHADLHRRHRRRGVADGGASGGWGDDLQHVAAGLHPAGARADCGGGGEGRAPGAGRRWCNTCPAWCGTTRRRLG